MPQLNIHMTPEFDRALRRLMRLRGIGTKSEAVRIAVLEALDRQRTGAQRTDFAEWIGIGCGAPQSTVRKFASEDDLWK